MVKTDLEKAGKTNLVGRNIYNRLEDLEGSGGGELPDLTEYAKLEDLDTATNFKAINPTLDTPAPEVLDKVLGDLNQKIGSGGGELPDLTAYALTTDVDTKDALLQTGIDTNTTNIDAIINAPLTPDADVLGTEEILSRKPDGTITTINQAVLAGSGGGELPDMTAYAKLEDLNTATKFTAINPTLDTPVPEVLDKVLGDLNQKIGSGGGELPDLTAYALTTDVDTKDALLQTGIDTNTTNIDAIINAPLTPDADVLGTEEILSRKPDGTITTINQAVLAGSGGGELPDMTAYAKLEDLNTATKFTAINPTLDTPVPEVLDKVVTDIENEVKTNATNIVTNTTSISTNTTAITGLTGRVENLENSGGGGELPVVTIDVDLQDPSFVTTGSIIIDCSTLDSEATTLNLINPLSNKTYNFINIYNTKICIIQLAIDKTGYDLLFESVRIIIDEKMPDDEYLNFLDIDTYALLTSMFVTYEQYDIYTPLYLGLYSFYLDISEYRKIITKTTSDNIRKLNDFYISKYMLYAIKNMFWVTDMKGTLKTDRNFPLRTLNNGIVCTDEDVGTRNTISLPTFRLFFPTTGSVNFAFFDLDNFMVPTQIVNINYLYKIYNRKKIRFSDVVEQSGIDMSGTVVIFYDKNDLKESHAYDKYDNIGDTTITFNCTSSPLKTYSYSAPSTRVGYDSPSTLGYERNAIWGIADIECKLFGELYLFAT